MTCVTASAETDFGRVNNTDWATVEILSTPPRRTFASRIHPSLLTIGVFSVFCGTAYAGLLLPAVRLFRFLITEVRKARGRPPSCASPQRSRYSHGPSRILQLWCLFICSGIFVGIYASGTVHYGHGVLSIGEFAEWSWHLAHYWDYAPSLKPVEYAWWLTMWYLLLDNVMTLIFALIRDWPKEDLKDPPDLLELEELQRRHLSVSSSKEAHWSAG